jgi:hypothetical protein
MTSSAEKFGRRGKKKKAPLVIFLLFDVIWTTEDNFLCFRVGQSSKFLGFAYL